MSFNGFDYLQQVARRLVVEFQDAGDAGTPSLIGVAREYPARAQLERLLPSGIGVGTGIVIDSFGTASRQQDIVLYEKHICPIFTYNNAPEATYFPVEGVIAVGEVKSSLDGDTLDDAFKKIISAKKLIRQAVATNEGLGAFVSYRHYGSTSCYAAVAQDEYSQDTKSLDQLFGFVLCGSFKIKPETIMQHAAELSNKSDRRHAPNFITSLADGFIATYKRSSNSITRSAMEADGMIFSCCPKHAFPELISLLRIYVGSGRTVAASHFERYFREPNVEVPQFPITRQVSAEWLSSTLDPQKQ